MKKDPAGAVMKKVTPREKTSVGEEVDEE